jgi:putative permease
LDLLKNWFKRYFSDPQVVILGVVLLVGLFVVIGLGKWLAPMFAAIIIAYLLEALVARLQKIGLPRMPSVIIAFLGFLALLFFLLFVVIPRISRQLTQLVQQFPEYLSKGQEALIGLPARYPHLITEEQVQGMMTAVSQELGTAGQQLLSWSLASVPVLFGLAIFLVLVPVLVFFLLKDKEQMIRWFVGFLPSDRSLVNTVWTEAETQIANYVRGKVLEIFIVGAVTYVTFILLGLEYAALLAALTGFSVLIPYIGAAVVTFPIALVAWFQFGWGIEFGQIIFAYGIIQALDGNVLVPLLFSEVVNLHPVAIILAILVFGGLWGFWGIFFAIPLATLVHAVLRAWPRDAGTRPMEEQDRQPAEAT